MVLIPDVFLRLKPHLQKRRGAVGAALSANLIVDQEYFKFSHSRMSASILKFFQSIGSGQGIGMMFAQVQRHGVACVSGLLHGVVVAI